MTPDVAGSASWVSSQAHCSREHRARGVRRRHVVVHSALPSFSRAVANHRRSRQDHCTVPPSSAIAIRRVHAITRAPLWLRLLLPRIRTASFDSALKAYSLPARCATVVVVVPGREAWQCVAQALQLGESGEQSVLDSRTACRRYRLYRLSPRKTGVRLGRGSQAEHKASAALPACGAEGDARRVGEPPAPLRLGPRQPVLPSRHRTRPPPLH